MDDCIGQGFRIYADNVFGRVHEVKDGLRRSVRAVVGDHSFDLRQCIAGGGKLIHKYVLGFFRVEIHLVADIENRLGKQRLVGSDDLLVLIDPFERGTAVRSVVAVDAKKRNEKTLLAYVGHGELGRLGIVVHQIVGDFVREDAVVQQVFVPAGDDPVGLFLVLFQDVAVLIEVDAVLPEKATGGSIAAGGVVQAENHAGMVLLRQGEIPDDGRDFVCPEHAVFIGEGHVCVIDASGLVRFGTDLNVEHLVLAGGQIHGCPVVGNQGIGKPQGVVLKS